MSRRADPIPLIHALLDAVGDDGAFTGALGGVGDPIGAVGTHAFLVRKADGVVTNSVGHARDGVLPLFEEYEERWRDVDPRYLTALSRPDEAHSDVAVVDPGDFERSGLYNEHLAIAGVRYTLFGSFSVGADLVLPIAFMRPKWAGAFQGDDVDYLSSLVPSLGRAFRLHDLVRSVAEENRDLRAALDRMPAAVALVGPSGRVRAANAAASAILSRGDGLCTERGILSARNADDARRLAASLGAALEEARPRARSSLSAPSVRIRRERGAPLDVVFLPLGGRPDASSEMVMAVVYDPDRAITLDVSRVAELHGLTATEAEIAVALAAGHTLTNIAAERDCSEETVRTHVKRVFSKTGLTRQAEIVRVLLSGPAVHPRS
jgi:DNA-binding CsgD family transcriptional regulator